MGEEQSGDFASSVIEAGLQTIGLAASQWAIEADELSRGAVEAGAPREDSIACGWSTAGGEVPEEQGGQWREGSEGGDVCFIGFRRGGLSAGGASRRGLVTAME